MNTTYQSSTYNFANQNNLLGSSNLKILGGQDLTSGDRKRMQQLQQQDWLNQQIELKNRAEEMRRQEKQNFDNNTKAINDMRKNLELEKAERLRNIEISVKNANRQQLQQKLAAQKNNQIEDSLDKLNHVQYVTNNDFYTENTATCQSMLGRNRVLPYHWKGMNEQQRQSILLEQQKQRKQKQLQSALQKQEQRLFALQQQAQRKHLVKLDREKNRGLQEKRKGVDEYNILKAEEMRRKVFHAYGELQTFKNE